MKEFEESRLVFRFDDDWNVVPWDADPAYRDPGGFGSISNTKACDFVASHTTHGVYLIEVKNFTGAHHQNRHRLTLDGLPLEAAEKVRDTLAGLVWARGRAVDTPPLRDVITSMLDAFSHGDARRIRVILWVEDTPPLRPEVASTLALSLQRTLLRWFGIRNVHVTSTRLSRGVAGLTVSPAT